MISALAKWENLKGSSGKVAQERAQFPRNFTLPPYPLFKPMVAWLSLEIGIVFQVIIALKQMSVMDVT